MTEHAQPVDIGKQQTAKHKSAIENLLASYSYGGRRYSLPDLLQRLDTNEPNIMGDLERDTYVALREGLQVFKAFAELLSDKTGLKRKIVETPTSELTGNRELNGLRDFCHNYATYAGSSYIVKKLEAIIRAANGSEPVEKLDLSSLTLDSAQPEEMVIKRLLAPMYLKLAQNSEKPGEVFKTPLDYVMFTKEVFEKYIELSLQAKEGHPMLLQNVDGYTFRVMDEFLVLKGYENRSIPYIKAAEQKIAFQPITAKEIVGNRSAKRKIVRYIERLALYDSQEKTNPMLELGGLSWSNLFDGLAGTGKSSLFRLAMTSLSEICQAIGLKHYIFTVDQSIKDEYYGKTGKILLERLAVTNDATALSMGVFDDLDLLTSTREDAQGADNDINIILMQYFDGAFTVKRGNVINFAATNKPTGIDDALRNRFNDRLLIDGPITAEDFADMLILGAGKLIKAELLRIQHGYEPFATQDLRDESGKWSGGDVAAYMADKFSKYKRASVIDFGSFMAELKVKNPRITGRSARAIIDSVKERCADFDIPLEWYGNRAKFLDIPYDRKLHTLAELYIPITPDVLFQEAQRFFDSEERFRQTETEGHVTRGYNNLIWNAQAELKFLEEQAELGDKGTMQKVILLRQFMQQRAELAEAAVAEAYRKAAKED